MERTRKSYKMSKTKIDLSFYADNKLQEEKRVSTFVNVKEEKEMGVAIYIHKNLKTYSRNIDLHSNKKHNNKYIVQNSSSSSASKDDGNSDMLCDNRSVAVTRYICFFFKPSSHAYVILCSFPPFHIHTVVSGLVSFYIVCTELSCIHMTVILLVTVAVAAAIDATAAVV